MIAAYADPPYVGQAKIHYADDERCAEVNHAVLIGTLDENHDAWALSCSTPSLRQLLPLCPGDVRVMAWVKPFAIFKPNVRCAYAWEPVIVRGGRQGTRQQDTVRDWVSCGITLKRGLVGVKPDPFAFWLFDVLNLEPDDTFIDVFPGSGAVTRAWEKWRVRTAPEQLELMVQVSHA